MARCSYYLGDMQKSLRAHHKANLLKLILLASSTLGELRRRQFSAIAISSDRTSATPQVQSVSVSMCVPSIFDAHNHITLSIPGGVTSLGHYDKIVNGDVSCHKSIRDHSVAVATHLAMSGDMVGLAIMSTQPRDFVLVDAVCKAIRSKGIIAKRGYGVHPWFLSDAQEEGDGSFGRTHDEGNHGEQQTFWWLETLRSVLKSHPDAIVGEIGLDGHRYDAHTKDLLVPMETQMAAFEVQLRLAAALERPVAVHVVRAWGPLYEVLAKIGRKNLPTKMYFHAFGGKAGVIDQIVALCGGSDIYFGFAPLNLRASKTAQVMRKVGIERLLLESDYENYEELVPDLQITARFMAESLELSPEVVLKQTHSNALDFYNG